MSAFRRNILANDQDDFEGIIMYFSNPSAGWYIEDEVNGNNEYYQIGDNEKVKLTERSGGSHYISFSSSQLQNTTLKIYTQSNISSVKGIKRRHTGLTQLDLSKMSQKSCWYMWGTQTYENLQTIIFPTVFKYQYLQIGGHFNNLIIPTTAQGIFTMHDAYTISFQTTGQHDHLRLWSNTSSSNYLNIMISLFPSNCSRGVFNIGPTAQTLITESQRQEIAAKNIVIRDTSCTNVYECDWSLP